MKTTLCYLIFLAAACGRGTSAPGDDAAIAGSAGSASAPRATASAPAAPSPSRYATRARPKGTFDLLSPLVAPGERTTQVTNLEPGWKVTGPPQLAADPNTGKKCPFVIESAVLKETVYTVTARNTGTAPCRLVADVPYSDK